jgi:hypothetical protein
MLDLLESVDKSRSVKQLNENIDQPVAEASDDQVKKVFKINGEPVGEVGIDGQASAGNGQWYMKCYKYNIDNSGYDSYKEAVAELKYCIKQGITESEKTMSRAAKGYEKYGKKGMMALAKAGREDAGEEKLDSIRDKYDRYDNDTKEDVNEESINEDSGGEIEVNFMNSGTGQKLGMKTVQNMGISLDNYGRPVMKVSSPFASGNTLMANFDSKTGGWVVDID